MINSLIVSAALMAAVGAPTQVALQNPPTDSAKAVYLADAAAKERGGRSEVIVLGTAHLSHLPKDFDVSRLRPLLDRLKAWAPDRIAIEALSGAQCDYLRAYAFAYPDTAKDYCYDPAEARAALGITPPEAEAEVERILATPAADRPADVRRRLAALFLVMGEPSSATVQWLRLPEAERKAGSGLTEKLASWLDGRLHHRNENILIAATLAADLGQERVYPVDDHTGDRATGSFDEKLYGQEMQQIWDNEWVKKRVPALNDWDKRIATDPSSSVLAWYSYMNSPEEARRTVASDFGAAAGARTPYNSGRKYLAYWETRNMRMAANIREVTGTGHRVLVIVGSSHKPYYERYLGVTSDLKIDDIEPLLK